MGGRTRWAAVGFALCASGLTVGLDLVQAQTAAGGAIDPTGPARAGLTRLRAGVPSQPAPAPPDAISADALSGDDLPEVEGHTAAGGTTVSLRGRFRTSVGMRRDPGGSTVGECSVTPPDPVPAD